MAWNCFVLDDTPSLPGHETREETGGVDRQTWPERTSPPRECQ
jgi:hypothetical protein